MLTGIDIGELIPTILFSVFYLFFVSFLSLIPLAFSGFNWYDCIFSSSISVALVF
jgi:hypothetical protein